MKWEYLMLKAMKGKTTDVSHCDEIEKVRKAMLLIDIDIVISTLGLNGWELVSVLTDTNGEQQFFMKRPMKE